MTEKKRPRSLLLPFTLGHFANDLVPCSVVIIAPAVALAMGLTPMEVGLLIAVHSMGSAIGFLPAGLLADSFSDRGRLLQATFWWVAAGYLLASFAPGFWSLALLFALAGSGDAAWHPLATTILVQNAPSRRAQALGIHAIGGTLSAVVGPVVVGFLLAQMDWRGALQIIVLPAMLMGLVFFRISRWVPKQNSGSIITVTAFRELWRIWTNREGMNIIALISVYHMALVAMLSMIPLYLQEYHGLSSSETGIAFAAMLFVGAVSQPLVGRLSDRAGRRRVIVLGNGFAALAAYSVGLFEDAGSLIGVLAALLAGVAVLECIRSSMLAVAVEHSKTREGATLGFAFSLMDGFGALGAVFAGWAAGIQFSHAFLLSSVLAVIAVILGLTITFRRSHGGSSIIPETP